MCFVGGAAGGLPLFCEVMSVLVVLLGVVGLLLGVWGVPLVSGLWLVGLMCDTGMVRGWRLRARSGELVGWRDGVARLVGRVVSAVWSCWRGVGRGLVDGVIGVLMAVLVGLVQAVMLVGRWPVWTVVVSSLLVVWGLLVAFRVCCVWRVGWVKPGVSVSVRRFIHHWGVGWLSVGALPLLAGVVAGVVGLGWRLAVITGLFVAVAACGLVWLVDSRRQLDRWHLLVQFQQWFDQWVEQGLKAYRGVRVVQANRVADTVVVRLRFPGSVTPVVKGGYSLVAGLLEAVGFSQGVLLRAWDKQGGLSARSVRLVVGDVESLPKLTEQGLKPGLARLVCDVAFARVGVVWGQSAPLCRVSMVGVNAPAWKVVLECDPAGVDKHKVGRDWVAGVVGLTPQQVVGLPVFVDPADEFLLFAQESTRLKKGLQERVTAGRVTRTLTDEVVARLPKKTGVVGVVGESMRPIGEGVRAVRVALPEGLSVGEWVACAPLLQGVGGCKQALVGVMAGSPVLILSERMWQVRVCEDDRVGGLLVRCLVWQALTACVGVRASVVSASACGAGVWQVRVAGVQVGDVVKKVEQVKSLLNVGLCVVEAVDSSHVCLWVAGDEFTSAWAQQVSGFDQLRSVWLAFCLALAGLTGVGGSLPVVETVERLSQGSRVERVRVVLPAGVDSTKVDSLLDRFITVSGLAYARVEQVEGVSCWLLVSDCDPLPTSLILPEQAGSQIVLGVDDKGEQVVWDYTHSPHLSVMGKTGAGKSSVLQTVMVQCLRAGWQACVADSQKQAADFVKWAKAKCAGVAVDDDHVEALLGWVDSQLDERASLCQQWGVSDVSELEEKVRPPHLLVVFDELNGYLAGLDAKPMANPTGDEQISNMNALVKNQVRSVGVTAGRLARVAVQGRSLGVHLLLGAQRLGRDEVKRVANANSFYRSLGKFLLGSDSLAGVVSANRLRQANRLQKSLMVAGRMPLGRGVYQSVQGDVVGVQAFYAGGVDRLTRLVEHVADVEAVDISRWLPESAEHYGLVGVEVGETVVEQAQQVDVSGFTWDL